MTRVRTSIHVPWVVAMAMLPGCASQPDHAPSSIDGETAYRENCLACHQADGRGVPYFQPPLVGSPWLDGEPQALAAFVLTGGFNSAARKQGPNENVMPAFTHLDDATLAALLTYVRARFGDGKGPVSPDVVTTARREIAP
jgi:mono/diheme cytochrome c family protein